MNRILQTLGQGEFEETQYDLPKIRDNEIQVRSVMTGICRSDVDMMTGSFGPLPLNMQGHEGLGQVVTIGNKIEDVAVGDYVATRGEPAYADIYNVRENEYVKVPEAHPRYIVEPVACGINLIEQCYKEIVLRSGPEKNLLILGSGFLAWVAFHTIRILELSFSVDVVGNSNKELWNSITKLHREPQKSYDVVIDLSNSSYVFDKWILKNQALIIMGAQKIVSTDFQNLLWKACTMIFPSPRNPNFYGCMQDAVDWIRTGKLNVDKFWTKGYNRDTEWNDAFRDGLNRPHNYSRGYLYWDKNGN
jgi:D-arabinose 1-dehydrogenase-like Zn-dependent alcohol dehydrogenase